MGTLPGLRWREQERVEDTTQLNSLDDDVEAKHRLKLGMAPGEKDMTEELLAFCELVHTANSGRGCSHRRLAVWPWWALHAVP